MRSLPRGVLVVAAVLLAAGPGSAQTLRPDLAGAGAPRLSPGLAGFGAAMVISGDEIFVG
ncbi:MAG: hypothetical protein GTO05_08465, partial [Gemmatimonadales bacterium]|nr:hypothetical protein [Gemmatimonadales bacterium]